MYSIIPPQLGVPVITLPLSEFPHYRRYDNTLMPSSKFTTCCYWTLCVLTYLAVITVIVNVHVNEVSNLPIYMMKDI